MAVEWIGPVPDTNYDVGRGGESVAFIVEHWTDARIDSAIARFMDPRSRVSAHYVIAQDGRILQLVSESDTAFHAGEYGANQRSIGIEHEASGIMPPSDALYAASARLQADIASRYGFALAVATTVVPHRAIVPTQCPGTLDLDRIVREAQAEDDVFTEDDRRKLNRVYDHLEAYEPLVWVKRLQQWLAIAIRSVFPNADLSGPDVETGQPFRSEVASRR
jgi:N-acetyl-anhydromuramyl-L-alanine amidase AmpD